ncbi:MAG: 50S ribosomal protein L3 [Erysipelotrichaceae bacterium]|nr:50S ribosomal protein L3 [Erysipelotrichaceae bacterium]MDD3924150.1 50S ribosomal protein L3 [Erysipelotrichaceae bacterium]MDD4641955.1 50S ribosomal protein L3 [Erysipelotrichaceae bacterium]
MKGILGRKLGMTQVFTTEGIQIPVTVIEVVPNVVLQQKTVETDGYVATQLGVEDAKERRATKAAIGHAKKAETAPKRFVREMRGDDMAEYAVGSEVKADLFMAGEIVDVTGVSKGKGFSGAIARHNQTIGPKSHGSGFHRGVGSLATIGRNNGVINKGTKMAGHDGSLTTTNQNLVVIKVDAESNYLLVKGNVPGPKRGFVVVKSAAKKRAAKEAVDLIDYAAAKEE